MRELSEIDASRLTRLRGLFFDIDETLSTDGKLTSSAYRALWDLHEARLRLVPVTGRPAGWCDHIARFWPVDAVIGESGAFYFHHDGRGLRRRFVRSAAERSEARGRLKAIGERIMREIPGCALASDQPYRECDIAIDYREDVEPLAREQVVRIKEMFEREGAAAKISSIHVNAWFGDCDKRSTALLCARELWSMDLESEPEAFAFCGDSPNDEPMFAAFPLSFAVANIGPWLTLLRARPAYVTPQAAGKGFCELAERILSLRGPGSGGTHASAIPPKS